MSELKQQYKNPHPGFGNVDHRILRDYKHVESLKEMRTRAFYDNRDLVNVSVASPQSAEDVPMMSRRKRKTLEWIVERKKRKKMKKMAIAEKNHKTSKEIGRLSADEIPAKDTVMKNLNISVEEEDRTAVLQYYKFLLKKETERLTEISTEIERLIKEEPN